MMLSEGRTANALGGKTARACDSCLRKRARWFCAADDAFLCQACDTSVHSANQLASRHERVRLETSSFKPTEIKGDENSSPVWHQGFTRKARTPRHNKPAQPPKLEQRIANSLPLVPEIGGEENSPDENEEQLLYRVPVLESFGAELCNDSNEVENIQTDEGTDIDLTGKESNVFLNDDDTRGLDIPEFIASDAELAEFAADVESLLGTGLDDDSCGIGGLGEIECKEEEGAGVSNFIGDKRVKIEDEDEEVQAVIASHFDPALDSARESFSWDFDYSSSPFNGEEEEMKMTIETPSNDCERKSTGKRRIFLKLNYEEVITAWDSQGCPWTNGTRPDCNPDDCWPDFLGNGYGTFQHPYGAAGGRLGGRDEEREARVSRYREKRRTRLFSKKIRYEVRKLNAEKRPRMKGRFVKRTSFAGSSSFPYLMNKS